MNVLYCGNDKIEHGLLISILSLANHVKEPLHIYILTMRFQIDEKPGLPVSEFTVEYLNDLVKNANTDSFVLRMDITELFYAEPPTANLDTRFTPYCMLRLFADKISELPDKILYLDTDVICRADFSDFYHQDVSSYEFVGVLDYYGSWFFRKHILRRDYINSGVLLMNLAMIRETKLLQKCRQLCAEKQMFMPDQSALNELAVSKKIQPRKFNEQRKLKKDTVFHHFTTSFRFFPWFRIVTVKPWEIEKVHSRLKLHEYDDLFTEFSKIQTEMKLKSEEYL